MNNKLSKISRFLITYPHVCYIVINYIVKLMQEKEIVTEEHKYKKEGESFNAKTFIEQEMELARKVTKFIYY